MNIIKIHFISTTTWISWGCSVYRSDRERLLQGTGVKQAVETDVTSLTKEFEELVLPFLRKHRDHFE